MHCLLVQLIKVNLALPVFIFLTYLVCPIYSDDFTGKILKIQSVSYDIQGRTSLNALDKELKWDFERFFSTPYDLDAYLQEKRQQLINKKIFKSVLTTYNVLSVEELIVHVDIKISIVDSWTLLPLPYYKYDDNLGLVLGFNFEYTNFAGTLTNLIFSSYYSENKSEITTEWTDFRIGIFLFDVMYNQLWETVRTTDSHGDINLKYNYLQSEVGLSLKIKLMKELLYSIRPMVRIPYSYSFYINETKYDDDLFTGAPVIPAYNHILEWNSVNWIGSFRQGINTSIENQIEYDSKKNDIIYWVDGIFKSYIFTPYVSLNTRVSAFYIFNDFKRNAGDRLRGILDYKMTGDRGFFLNQNFPFEVFSIKKAGVLQLSPFFDAGAVFSNSEIQGLEGVQYTAGCSLIFFPAFLSSFSINIDAGINLRNFSETEIGLSSHLYF